MQSDRTHLPTDAVVALVEAITGYVRRVPTDDRSTGTALGLLAGSLDVLTAQGEGLTTAFITGVTRHLADLDPGTPDGGRRG